LENELFNCIHSLSCDNNTGYCGKRLDQKLMKKIYLLFFILGMIAYFFIPTDADLTGKLPMISSHTTLDAEFLEGGPTCLQWTTVVPDKFQARTRMECK
jgi:hypothetical protein